MRDMKNNVDASRSIKPQAHTVSVNGTGVSLKGYRSAMVVIDPGTITDGTHTPKVQESDSLATGYTDVAAADLEGTLAALATDTIQRAGYKGAKEYIRVVSTVAAATVGGIYGASVMRGDPHQAPI